jgi:hypothetical protein
MSAYEPNKRATKYVKQKLIALGEVDKYTFIIEDSTCHPKNQWNKKTNNLQGNRRTQQPHKSPECNQHS